MIKNQFLCNCVVYDGDFDKKLNVYSSMENI